ncbi:MAG: phycobilisome linker polypeptide [Phormidesmis priestleyi]|uniref:Phycobilisome linker polypeptide n=1 Tax=Phormidesmis priestleyi TaxID=268141 RepID=A0A2W4XSG8_9CYAN|nr:MAG: phycobilisome linker polypeptide [Phormidesmis priestleyi]
MLGQSATGGVAGLDNRIFLYEIEGLSQNETVNRSRLPVRPDQNQLFQVPFHRMNEEMQRILLLGGKIVNIRPLGSAQSKELKESKESTEKAQES